MKRFVLGFGLGLGVALGGCLPNVQQTQATMADEHAQRMASSCEQTVQSSLANHCTDYPSPLPEGWVEQVRVTHAHQRDLGCAPAVIAPLEQCAAKLDAIAHAEDPDKAQRRAAAKPNAERTRKDPAFKRLIEEWLGVYDQTKIICRAEGVSPSHQRECERSRGDLVDVEEKLKVYLVGRGFDLRDISSLGLWPVVRG